MTRAASRSKAADAADVAATHAGETRTVTGSGKIR